jgi:hypothetical protein
MHWYGCIRLRVHCRSCDDLAINYQEELPGPDEAPLEICVHVATTTTTTTTTTALLAALVAAALTVATLTWKLLATC